MIVILLILLLLASLITSGDVVERNNNLNRLLLENRIRKSGHVELGGLFSVHTSLDKKWGAYCTGYDLTSVLSSQAMIYEVDKINTDPNILQNLTLGYEMMDDCCNLDLAVKASMIYLMGETAEDRRKWILEYRKNRMDMAKGHKKHAFKIRSPKLAIIGPSSSDTATAIASMLHVHGLRNLADFSRMIRVQDMAIGVAYCVKSMASVNLLPIISYSATSCELSQKKKYPSFLRTIPSDALQVQAMADLIQHFNWTWISAIGTDDTYGQFGVQLLKEELLSRNICLAKELLTDYRLSRDSIKSTLNDLFNDSLSQKAEIVVLICTGAKVDRFLQVLNEEGIYGKTWIASESWGFREIRLEYKEVVHGALGVVVSKTQPIEFINHVNSLTVNEIKITNPWFYEYLLYAKVVNLTDQTKSDETLMDLGFRIDPVWYSTVTHVMDAVRASAMALHRLIYEKAKPLDTLYPIDLLRSLRSGTFQSSFDPNHSVKFNKKGDITEGYNIMNLKLAEEGDRLRFYKVGTWHTENIALGLNEERLCLDESNILWANGSDGPPESICQKECPPGMYKIYGGSKCCWTCRVCPPNEFSNTSGSLCCKKCPAPKIHNADHTDCVYRSDFADWKSAGELVALSVAALGMMMDMTVSTILFIYRRTPVVVCSNAPLTFILLYLLAMAFTLPILYVLKPSTGLCFVETVLFGWTFSTITGIFFTKTYHVRRIFTAKLSHTLHMLSQRGLQRREIWLSLGLGAIVLIPTIPYLIVHEPMPARGDCGEHWINIQLVNMAYIALLSLATTYVSFRARNLPENYNEAHTVATTMLMLLLVWLSSLPSYYRVSISNRALILGLAVDAAALCILVLVFGPKLYLIFIEPHKNTPLYVSRMNMMHLWKEQSKKRISSTTSSRTNTETTSTDDALDSAPAPKRSRMDILNLAKRSLKMKTSNWANNEH